MGRVFDAGQLVEFGDAAPSVVCSKYPGKSKYLPRGLYYVACVKSKGKNYQVGVYPVRRHFQTLERKPERWEFQGSAEGIYQRFGAKVVTSAMEVSFIDTYLEAMFKEYGREDLYEEGGGKWGGYFRTTMNGILFSNKTYSQISESDLQDKVVEALLNTVTENTVEKYDPESGNVKAFFGKIFGNHLRNAMKKWAKDRTHENVVSLDDDMEGEESGYLERKMFEDDPYMTQTEDSVGYEQLMKELEGYLEQQVEGASKKTKETLERVLEAFRMLVYEQLDYDEMRERLGITFKNRGKMTFILKRLRKEVMDYAKQSDNDELKQLVKMLLEGKGKKVVTEGSKSKFSDTGFEYVDIFQGLHNSKHTYANLPSGQMVKVQRKRLENRLEHNFIAQDLTLTDAQLDSMHKEMLSEMMAADDVVEAGGTLVTLTRMGEVETG